MSLWKIIDKPLSLLEIKLEVEIKKYFQAADQRELDRDIYRPAGFLKK